MRREASVASTEVRQVDTQEHIVDESRLAHTRGQRDDRAVRGSLELGERDRVSGGDVLDRDARSNGVAAHDVAQLVRVARALFPQLAGREETARERDRVLS